MSEQRAGQVAGPALVVDGSDVLLGYGRCESCAQASFPPQNSCPACGSELTVQELTPPRGELWSWTVQRFRPTSPPFDAPAGQEFEPFGVGVVRFADDLRVVGRLSTADPAALRIGMQVRITASEHRLADGSCLPLYEFAPVEEVAS